MVPASFEPTMSGSKSIFQKPSRSHPIFLKTTFLGFLGSLYPMLNFSAQSDHSFNDVVLPEDTLIDRSLFRRIASRGVLMTVMAVWSIPAPSHVRTFNAPAVLIILRVIHFGLGFPFNSKRHLAKADSPKYTRNTVENKFLKNQTLKI